MARRREGAKRSMVPGWPLARDDGSYLIVWRYEGEDGRTERHMSAWLAGERRLFDNGGLVLAPGQ